MAPPPSGPPKPKMSRGATPAELQAAKLNKLLANPDKDIYIAPRPKEGVQNTLRAPREMMKNVQGSSAGAGSGEFHVYKQSRRREYERLKIMDEEEEYDKNKREALERQAANEAAADEKTAKNRLKRQRQKDARSKGKKPSGGAASASAAGGVDGDAAVGDKKRKLAGGAAFKFKSVEEREAEDEEENDEDAPARKPELKLAQPAFADDAELRRLQEEEERAAPAKEAGITIQDDD